MLEALLESVPYLLYYLTILDCIFKSVPAVVCFISSCHKYEGPLPLLRNLVRHEDHFHLPLEDLPCVTVVISAIRARARINNIKANSVILRLFFSFSFHLKRREIKLRCRSNMPQPDSQRIILISNELQNIYLELFQIEFQ